MMSRLKTFIPAISLLLLIMAGAVFSPPAKAAEWKGVDEKVVEKFAKDAGRPPREPYINTDRGDLLLFLFLVAGAAGGFVAGYCFRSLFPPKSGPKEK